MQVRLSPVDDKRTHFSLNHDGGKERFSPIGTVINEKFDAELTKAVSYRSTGILPPAVRFISPDHSVVLWERPPCYVTFQYTQLQQEEINADNASQHVVRLPIPWQRYVLLLSPENMIANAFMFFARQELDNLYEDPLYVAPILNFYQNSRLCPASYNSQPEYARTIEGAMDYIYQMIWSSGFNWDTTLAIQTLRGVAAGHDGIQNPMRSFYGDPQRLYKYWATQEMDTVMTWPWVACYSGFMQLFESQDLYHNYTGNAHDLLVNMVLSAQDAM